MQYVAYLLLMALVFGACFLVDKGFTKIFRGKKQHKTGLSVRVNRRYGAFGLILFALGVAAIFSGISGKNTVLIVGGAVVLVAGIGMIVYYMTFGVYYDDDSFILTTFGRKSKTYQFRNITSQQLYNASSNILIELELDDGRSVGLQAAMTGVYPFLDTAFAGWCRQKGIDPADCPFHDPDNSCWFPPVGEA